MARLTRPGNTVVRWPKGEGMVMPRGEEEMARWFLGLLESGAFRVELLMGYCVGGARVKLGVRAGLKEEEQVSRAAFTLEQEPRVVVEEVSAVSGESVVEEERRPGEQETGTSFTGGWSQERSLEL